MITEKDYLAAKSTIELYEEQIKQNRLNRIVSFGDFVRAKCSAPARAIGNGKCLYVSAMSNDLCKDDIDMQVEWINPYNLPLPSDDDLKRYE